MRNVLVTGGQGFIGKALVQVLRGKSLGYDVTVLDKGGYDRVPKEEWDCIIHLAALARVSDAEKDPALCMDSNLTLTAKVLAMSTKALILASTCSPPTTIYGMSKEWAEKLAIYEAKRRGFALRVLRFTSVHGAGENPNKLLPKALDAAKRGIRLALSKDALPLEYVNVYRVVNEIMNAMLDAERNPAKTVEPRKLCDGIIRTEQELMDWAKNVVHPDPQPA